MRFYRTVLDRSWRDRALYAMGAAVVLTGVAVEAKCSDQKCSDFTAFLSGEHWVPIGTDVPPATGIAEIVTVTSGSTATLIAGPTWNLNE